MFTSGISPLPLFLKLLKPLKNKLKKQKTVVIICIDFSIEFVLAAKLLQ